MQTSKYLLANERDAQWGLSVSTVGYEEIAPDDSYPTIGHADGYDFNVEKGRILNEYQLLYNPEGSGIFESAHCPPTRLKAAICSCYSRESGTPTIPMPEQAGKVTG